MEAAITPRTKAIIPVHFYGQPAELDPILEIARKHNIPVIEDAAQAHGATTVTAKSDLWEMACFSFYPGKNPGAYGDTGALVTNDDELAKKIRMLRDHGRTSKYEHEITGYGYRLDGIQGADFGCQIEHLTDWNEQRRRPRGLLHRTLTNVDDSIVLPYEPPHSQRRVSPVCDSATASATKFVVFENTRHRGRDSLSVPLHLQPVYRNLGYGAG